MQDHPSAFPTSQQQPQPSAKQYPSAGEAFLNGAMRALGGVVVYSLFVAAAFFAFQQFVWPDLKPYADSYQDAIKVIVDANDMFSGSGDGNEAGRTGGRASVTIPAESFERATGERVTQEQIDNLLRQTDIQFQVE